MSRVAQGSRFPCSTVINRAHVYSPNCPGLVWMINSMVSLVFCQFLSTSLIRPRISIYNHSPRHRVPCVALGFLHFSALAAFNAKLLQVSAAPHRLLQMLRTSLFALTRFIHLWISVPVLSLCLDARLMVLACGWSQSPLWM